MTTRMNLDKAGSGEITRRRMGRVETESIACTLGPLLDLSAGGMRVETSKVPKEPVPVTLSDGSMTLNLTAEAQWSRKLGWFKREVGFKFLNLSDVERAQLTRMATSGRMRRVI